MTISDSWQATNPRKSAIFVLSIIVSLLSLVMQAVVQAATTNIISGMIIGFFSSWILLIISVTLLTTLYGHLIEGRPLD